MNGFNPEIGDLYAPNRRKMGKCVAEWTCTKISCFTHLLVDPYLPLTEGVEDDLA